MVQCAVRLLLLDRLQRMEPGDAEEARAQLKEWAHPLGEGELREMAEFAPCDREACMQAVVRAGETWGTLRTEAGLPALCAFAVLFTDENDVRVPAELLSACERLDRFNAARDSLTYAMVRRAGDGSHARHGWAAPEVRSERMRLWARSKTLASFSDDVKASFVEALVRTRLNPVFEWDEGERPAAALGRVQPERALAVMAVVGNGIRIMEGECAAEDEDTLTIHLFCYYMEQMHAVDWAKNFYITHHAPFGALNRIQRYVNDRMMRPPPLVVRTLEGWFVVERTERPGNFESVWRYDRAAGALGHWCEWVKVVRKSSVALGRSCTKLFEDIEANAGATLPLTLRLKSVFGKKGEEAR